MISVTILTKNNEQTLENTLESLKTFKEVLIFDTGSSDNTLLIAQRFPNVRIHQDIFEGFGPSHNRASSLAYQDWILSIDSDEVLSFPLIEEIHRLSLDPTCVYQIQRRNFFNGKWIKGCGGWYPDPVVRLYHRKATRFTEDAVHEKILAQGLSISTLTSPLYHTPYRSIDDFLDKMQKYSTLFAKQHTTRMPFCKAIVHSWFAFFKSYILKRGFLNGKEGFIISIYNGHTTFYKYLKVMEHNRCLSKKDVKSSF